MTNFSIISFSRFFKVAIMGGRCVGHGGTFPPDFFKIFNFDHLIYIFCPPRFIFLLLVCPPQFFLECPPPSFQSHLPPMVAIKQDIITTERILYWKLILRRLSILSHKKAYHALLNIK